MSNFTRSELVSFEKLTKLVFTDALNNHPYVLADKSYLKDIYKYCSQLLGKIKNKKGKYGIVPTTYKSSDGRRYSTGSSLQKIDGIVRNLLIGEFCYDADIVNSCPSILRSVMKNAKIKVPILNKYCDNRDNIIKDIIKFFEGSSKSATRYDIKRLFTILTFGGSPKTWMNEFDSSRAESFHIGSAQYDSISFVFDFYNEMQKTRNIIFKHPEKFNCVDLKKEIEREQELNPNLSKSWKGSLMCKMLQREERRVIDILESELEQNEFTINAIVHDGLNVYDSSMRKNKTIENKLIKVLKSAVKRSKTELNLNIDIIPKDMDTKGFSVDEYIVNQKAMDHFDIQYMNNLKSYDRMKTYFELFYGYVKQVGLYYEVSKSYCYQHNVSTMRELLGGITYYQYITNSEGKTTEITDEFFKKYRKDTTRKIYNKAGVYLDQDIDKCISENNFNCSVPLPPIPQKPKKYDTFINHFRKLIGFAIGDVGNVKGHIDYVIEWMADMIQNPTKKATSTSLIITGDQGTGKSSIVSILSWIFNDRIYSESSTKSLQDGFNIQLLGKMLFAIEEAEGDEKVTGRMKDFITNINWTFEGKGDNKITAPTYTRLLSVSNKKVPVYVDSNTGDRRFAVFRSFKPTSDSKRFFKKFFNVYAPTKYYHKDFCDAVHNYLATFKITIDNFQEARPLTDAYRKLMLRCVNKKVQFMTDFIETCKFEDIEEDGEVRVIDENYGKYWESKAYNKTFECSKTEFFEYFKEYITEEYNQSNKKLNKTEFFNDLDQYFGVKEKRTAKSRMIAFIPSKIMKIAKKNNWILEYHGQRIISSINDISEKYEKDDLNF